MDTRMKSNFQFAGTCFKIIISITHHQKQFNMKKIYFPLLVTMILATSCQMKTKSGPFDPVAAKAEITKTLDSLDMALTSKDAKTFLSFYAEDGLYCGTDPTELWDKSAYSKEITSMMTDTASFSGMTVTKREILVDKSGISANVLRQFVTKWSKPIEVRSTLHLVKTENAWKIDFASLAMVSENKYLPKLTAAAK